MGDPPGEAPWFALELAGLSLAARFTAPCATAVPQVLANCIIRPTRPWISFNCARSPRAAAKQSIARGAPIISLLFLSHNSLRTDSHSPPASTNLTVEMAPGM